MEGWILTDVASSCCKINLENAKTQEDSRGKGTEALVPDTDTPLFLINVDKVLCVKHLRVWEKPFISRRSWRRDVLSQVQVRPPSVGGTAFSLCFLHQLIKILHRELEKCPRVAWRERRRTDFGPRQSFYVLDFVGWCQSLWIFGEVRKKKIQIWPDLLLPSDFGTSEST